MEGQYRPYNHSLRRTPEVFTTSGIQNPAFDGNQPSSNFNRNAKSSQSNNAKKGMSKGVKKKVAIVIAMMLLLAFAISMIVALRPLKECNPVNSTDNLPAPTTTTLPPGPEWNYEWSTSRLPTTVTPVSYNLTIHPHLQNKTFTGYVEIQINCEVGTNFIVVHSENLNWTSIVFEDDSTELEITDRVHFHLWDHVLLKFKYFLAPKITYYLRIHYVGVLADVENGIYVTEYHDANGSIRHGIATKFYPINARAVFPCFDEPALKAKFNLSVVRPAEEVVISGTPLVASITNEDSLIKDNFEVTPPISTYMMGFTMGQFQPVKTYTREMVKLNVFTDPKLVNQSEKTLELSQEIVRFFYLYLNMTFPMKELNIVVLSNHIGRSVSWGMVITNDLEGVIPENGTELQEVKVMLSLSKMLAKQFFGGVVTMNWWNEGWFEVGLSEYLSYVTVDYLHPKWEMENKFNAEVCQQALHDDTFFTSHVLSGDVSIDPVETDVEDIMAHKKAACLFRMLKEEISRMSFRQGLYMYLENFAYKTAGPEELWKIFNTVITTKVTADAIILDIEDCMKKWTHQKGYPLVNVIIESSNKRIGLTQEHFMYPKRWPETNDHNKLGYEWKFVVNCKTDRGTVVRIAMKKSLELAILEDDFEWLLCNVGHYGFYRVNYGDEYWKKLTIAITERTGDLTDADVAGLVDDAISINMANKLKIEIAMNLTMAAMNTSSYIVWATIVKHVKTIKNSVVLIEPLFSIFKNFSCNITSRLYKTMLYEPQQSFVNSSLQSIIIDVVNELGCPYSRELSYDLFQQSMNGSSQIKNFEIMRAVYKAGIRNGDDEDFHRLVDKFRNSTMTSLNAIYLSALGASTVPNHLQFLLHKSVESDLIKPTEVGVMLESMGGHVIGRFIAWRFIRDNWLKYLNLFNNNTNILNGMLQAAFSQFNSHVEILEMKAFMQANDLSVVKLLFEESIRSVDHKHWWIHHYGDALKEWLVAINTTEYQLPVENGTVTLTPNITTTEKPTTIAPNITTTNVSVTMTTTLRPNITTTHQPNTTVTTQRPNTTTVSVTTQRPNATNISVTTQRPDATTPMTTNRTTTAKSKIDVKREASFLNVTTTQAPDELETTIKTPEKPQTTTKPQIFATTTDTTVPIS